MQPQKNILQNFYLEFELLLCSPSVEDLAVFLKKYSRFYLKPNLNEDASRTALKAVEALLIAVIHGSYSHYQRPGALKKPRRAREALLNDDIEGVCAEIISVFLSKYRTELKLIKHRMTEYKREVIEGMGGDYHSKVACKRDEDEIENQVWTRTGVLAIEEEVKETREDNTAKPLALKPAPAPKAKEAEQEQELKEGYIYKVANNTTYINRSKSKAKKKSRRDQHLLFYYIA